MKQLILLGASVRAAANSTIRAGWRPWAIDLFADRDLRAMCPAARIERYPHDFLRALEGAPIAPWVYTGGLENFPRLVDRLAAIRPLLGNAGTVLRRVRNLRLLGRTLRDAGFHFPQTYFDTQWPPSDAPLLTSRWIIKPTRGSGGMSVRLATGRDTKSRPRGHVVQQFIPGAAASALFVGSGRTAKLLGASRQLLGSDFGLQAEFAYAGSIGPLSLARAELEQLHALGAVLVDRFGLVGLFGVDYVCSSEGLTVIEVNPRYTASVEVFERALDASLLNWHIAACQGESLPSVRAASPQGAESLWGKAVVFARQSARATKRLEQLAIEWNAAEGWPLIADLPFTGQHIAAGHPVATVFAQGLREFGVEEALRRRVAIVEEALDRCE